MEKYIGTFENEKQFAVWSIDIKAAKFHLKDYERQNGKLIKVKKVTKS